MGVEDLVRWERATPPAEIEMNVGIRDVDNAVLSPFAVRAEGRRRKLRGAVYTAAGTLVEESLRLSGPGGLVVEDNPRSLPPEDLGRDMVHLRGTWLYGGHWMPEFGHFITETVTRLWPDPRPVAGVVYHRFVGTEAIKPWQTTLITRAGWGAAQTLVNTRWARVDHLVVPSRTVFLSSMVHPTAVRQWERMSPNAHTAGEPVFLSRSRLTSDPRRTRTDPLLDREFAARGFRVFHPQEHPVDEQIRVASQAPVLAGAVGSALHLSAFASPDCRTIELGDIRTRDRPHRPQRAIDAACGRLTAHVPYYEQDGARDISSTSHALDAIMKSS